MNIMYFIEYETKIKLTYRSYRTTCGVMTDYLIQKLNIIIYIYIYIINKRVFDDILSWYIDVKYVWCMYL